MPTGNPNEPAQQVVEIGRVSGIGRQLTPDEQQFVDGELQTITRAPMPTIPLEEPPKKEATLPAGAAYPTGYTPITEGGGEAGAVGPIIPYTYPILRINRYSGTETTWQVLAAWDIPDGWIGDLHEISINSDDDDHTRWRIILANVDQNIPTDRPMSTPWTGPWRDIKIPPGFSVRIDVMSTDGTAITADASITGSITALPS